MYLTVEAIIAHLRLRHPSFIWIFGIQEGEKSMLLRARAEPGTDALCLSIVRCAKLSAIQCLHGGAVLGLADALLHAPQ